MLPYLLPLPAFPPIASSFFARLSVERIVSWRVILFISHFSSHLVSFTVHSLHSPIGNLLLKRILVDQQTSFTKQIYNATLTFHHLFTCPRCINNPVRVPVSFFITNPILQQRDCTIPVRWPAPESWKSASGSSPVDLWRIIDVRKIDKSVSYPENDQILSFSTVNSCDTIC